MPSVVQESSSSYQSSQSSSSSSQGVQELLAPNFSVDKSDSVHDMLQEMSDLNKKMLEKYFKGDRESMTEHYKKAIDSTITDDTSTMLAQRSQLLKKQDSLEDYQEHEDRVEIKVNLREYKPDEVVIRTVDNEVCIDAQHQEVKDGKNYVSRQFSRHLTLPSNVIFDKISCALNASGTLNIVAPKTPKSQIEPCEKVQKSSTKSESNEVDEAGGEMSKKSESHREEKVVKTQGGMAQMQEMHSKSQTSYVKQEKTSGEEHKASIQQKEAAIDQANKDRETVKEVKVENERGLKKDDRSFFDDFFGRSENKHIDSAASRIEEHMNRFGKQEMFETRDPIKDMISRMKDRHQRLLDRHFKGDSDEMFHEYHDFLNKHFSDDPFLPYYTRSMSRLDHQQPSINENDKEIEIQLRVSQFKPNEISVKTKDRCLEIEGKHEEEDGAISRHLRRKYTLPSGVEADQISSKLTPEGMLLIKIPKLQRITGERVIPVKMIEA